MVFFATFMPMRRAMGWFGLVFMVWAMAGVGIHFFWSSTSAKRSLAERVASGEALERWVLTEKEYTELGIVGGEFWHEDRIYDVMHTEHLNGGLVAIQVFDDSYETEWAKVGRKLLRRKVEDRQGPPAGLALWVSVHAVLPKPVVLAAPLVWRNSSSHRQFHEGAERKRATRVYSPPETGRCIA